MSEVVPPRRDRQGRDHLNFVKLRDEAIEGRGLQRAFVRRDRRLRTAREKSAYAQIGTLFIDPSNFSSH